MPWNAEEGGGFTSGEPWHAFAPGRELANVAVQDADPGSLLERYRRLIRLRAASSALRRGGQRFRPTGQVTLRQQRQAVLVELLGLHLRFGREQGRTERKRRDDHSEYRSADSHGLPESFQ